jgi:hypothetical protein
MGSIRWLLFSGNDSDIQYRIDGRFLLAIPNSPVILSTANQAFEARSEMFNGTHGGRTGSAASRFPTQTLFDDRATAFVVAECRPFAINQDLIASKQEACYQDRLDCGLIFQNIFDVLLQG